MESETTLWNVNNKCCDSQYNSLKVIIRKSEYTCIYVLILISNFFLPKKLMRTLIQLWKFLCSRLDLPSLHYSYSAHTYIISHHVVFLLVLFWVLFFFFGLVWLYSNFLLLFLDLFIYSEMLVNIIWYALSLSHMIC